MASEHLHEDPKVLGEAVIDCHRAIVSMMEELEAIDWYQQRVTATMDEDLRAVLAHNRDEEKEHAAMVLEWLRRHDRVFDQHLRKYLFTDEPLAGFVAEEKGEPPAPVSPDGHLGIGDLRHAANEG